MDAHDANYIDFVKKSFPSKGFSSLDGDTIISPGSKEATFDAAGSIMQLLTVLKIKNLRMLFALFVLQGIIVIKIKLLVFAFLII